MKEKALEIMGLTVGTFNQVVEAVALENIEETPRPPELDRFIEAVKSALASHRDAFEDAITAVYAKHFTESDLDKLLAFYNSDIGQKIRTTAIPLQGDLMEATANWRNAALDAHRDELQPILGVVEAQPAPAGVQATAIEPPSAAYLNPEEILALGEHMEKERLANSPVIITPPPV